MSPYLFNDHSTSLNRKNKTSWNIKEKHKQTHPTKANKRKQQQKHQIEASDSPEIDLFEEEAKENSEVSFLLNNSRTNEANTKTGKKTAKSLPALKDLWIGKESVPLDSSNDSVNSPSASLLSLPEEHEDAFAIASKLNANTSTEGQTLRTSILVDSQTESEDFPSWGTSLPSVPSFPSLSGAVEGKDTEKRAQIQQSPSVSSISGASDTNESEISTSSEIQTFNTLEPSEEGSVCEISPPTSRTQSSVQKSSSTVIVMSSSEESESVSELSVITPVPAPIKVLCSPLPSPPRSPRSPCSSRSPRSFAISIALFITKETFEVTLSTERHCKKNFSLPTCGTEESKVIKKTTRKSKEKGKITSNNFDKRPKEAKTGKNFVDE